MRRWWLLIPVCFLVAPAPPCPEFPPYITRGTGEANTRPGDDEPNSADGDRPSRAAMERLARHEPLVFLKHCLDRGRAEVRGYRAVVRRQERLQGVLYPPEVLEVAVRSQPFAVLVNWREGARRAQRVLFAEGQYDNKILVVPRALRSLGSWTPVFRRDPTSADARSNGRYPIEKSGILQGTEKVIEDWSEIAGREKLDIEYRGVRQVREANGRRCFELHRHCPRPEMDGILDVTLFFDVDTWLQVGTRVTGVGGDLIGSYFFLNLELNPTFSPDQFTEAALNR